MMRYFCTGLAVAACVMATANAFAEAAIPQLPLTRTFSSSHAPLLGKKVVAPNRFIALNPRGFKAVPTPQAALQTQAAGTAATLQSQMAAPQASLKSQIATQQASLQSQVAAQQTSLQSQVAAQQAELGPLPTSASTVTTSQAQQILSIFAP